MSDAIRLDFVMQNSKPTLHQSVLTVNGQEVLAGVGKARTFHPRGKGVRILSLALVRLARWVYNKPSEGKYPMHIPLLSGKGRPSLTASLGDAIMKPTNQWIADMFAVQQSNQSEAQCRLRRWFHFENVQGKRQHETMTVSACTSELSPESVTIMLDGACLNPGELDRLERRLAGDLDGSLPPMGDGGSFTLAGYLPSCSEEFVGRNDILNSLDIIYDEAPCRILTLLGQAGAGKTTVAREWIGRRIMSNTIRHKLIFGWSFYRQGYGAGSSQILTGFFTQLGEALGVKISDGMLADDVAETIINGIIEKPTLLFLDGLEVMLYGAHDKRSMEIKDSRLKELLIHIARLTESVSCWVLLTSRDAFKENDPLCYPEVQNMKLSSLPEELRSGTVHGTSLEYSIARGQTENLDEAASLIAAIERDQTGDATPTLVRQALERMEGHPGRSLLLSASLFERAPTWVELMTFLGGASIARLTNEWGDLSETDWEEVLDTLQEKNLLKIDHETNIVVHAKVVGQAAIELKNSMPQAWIEGHRRLYDYFAGIPEDYYPSTTPEMDPLFRAAWHGINAGDYRRVFDEMCFARVSRENRGYIFFEIGAYQEALNILTHLSPDQRSFPPGCDLDADSKMIVLHGSALCLRYMDRLEEAYECYKHAWTRLSPGHTLSSIAPLCVHLLRCHQIFGDINLSGAVFKKLIKSLLSTPATGTTLRLPPDFLAMGEGTIAAICATTLWMTGHCWSARLLLKRMVHRCSKLLKREVYLAPGFGGAWHALLLLDMGEWRYLKQALDRGDLDEGVKRNAETGMYKLIKGRLLSIQSKEEGNLELAVRGRLFLEEGLSQVQRLPFRWWVCTFLLALARHHHLHGENSKAKDYLHKCQPMAEVNGFKLLSIDVEILQAQINKKKVGKDLTKRIKSLGYGIVLKKA